LFDNKINNIYFKNIINYKIDYILQLYNITVSTMSVSRYELSLCQKFNEKIHGFNPNTSSPDIRDHYICLFTFVKPLNFTDYIAFARRYGTTIEIVEIVMLDFGGEAVAIYKTFWFRIFQRMCRKWVSGRKFARSSRLYSLLLKREYQYARINI
jgi:hypothetical protein